MLGFSRNVGVTAVESTPRRRSRRSLGAAIIIALIVGLVAHVLHVGHHAGHGAGSMSGMLHWLRDAVLAIPVAALVVVAANGLIGRRPQLSRFLGRLRWSLLVGIGYAAVLIPGGLAHGFLFPAERSEQALIHAVADAVALLPASLYTALGVAFLLGIPGEARSPMAVALRAVRRWVAAHRARGAVAGTAFLTVMPAFVIIGSLAAAPTPAADAAEWEFTECADTRTITADVVALDQTFYYNRLGALNANGMIYALARDVVTIRELTNDGITFPVGTPVSELDDDDRQALVDGIAPGDFDSFVELRADKRPRPLTLRANEGDCLEISFTNLLHPRQFKFNLPPEFPRGQILGLGVPIDQQIDDQPLTRVASIHVDGLELYGDISSDGSNVGRNGADGNGLVAPGATTTYTYFAPNRGTHLLYSMGTTVGAEATGGTRSYGLFGAVNVQPGPRPAEDFTDLNFNDVYDLGEPYQDSNGDGTWNAAFAGSQWYRSQLTRQEMDWATPPEAFTDWNENTVWDAAIAEPLTDWNGNAVQDDGIAEPLTDWNGNEVQDNGIAEPLTDWNGNAVQDNAIAEPLTDWNGNGFQDNGIAEPFIDSNGNGAYDPGEPFTDWNGSGVRDASVNEPFTDWNGSGGWDASVNEPFTDWNGSGVWDASVDEPFTDWNGSDVWDAIVDEPFTDWNENGVWDASVDEPLEDTNGDGVWNERRTTPGGQPLIDYNAVYPDEDEVGPGKAGLPIIKILNAANEIVHSDLNAIIDDRGFPYPPNLAYPTRSEEPFREFTVIFHDEAFGVQAFPGFYNDPVLKHTLHGVRDSFPINYGSGGIGSEIIANRLGVGPMWDCAECKYEEFFLTSFTVGDPAMIVDIPANADLDGDGMPDPGSKATKALYPDDPSNVHHAYLGDRVVFRNLHAGPKEHHIFHLHAHQWQFNPDDPQSSYLDGQAVGPGSGYSYEIAYGGSGNRNLTPGDSIFHCHFYPHFAQGMWELWRVHDTFQWGTVMGIDAVDGLPIPAAGSRALPDGEIVAGTPIPGVVPMPGVAMAPMPDPAATIVASDLSPETFTDANGNGMFDDGEVLTRDENGNGLFDAFTPDSSQFDANGDGTADWEQMNDPDFELTSNPGYPWYTPGVVGHRPPTPALDLEHDGGLPRHIITSGPDEFPGAVEMYVSRLDFNKVLHHASAVEVPEGGTVAELAAMNFHADQFHDSYLPIEPDAAPTVAEADVAEADFETNGLAPQAGAPFADPCRTDPDPVTGVVGPITQNRTIKGANIEMPIVLNKVGWHFQQQRFEALWEDVMPTLTHERAPQPMVMRLNSTDCAEYHHANLVPNVYQLDDYQVRTPTDIIGQHIHLVKFDVMSADGSANGWNYEDGTLSPDEVIERIHALNAGGGLDGDTDLHAAHHPFFGDTANVPNYVCEDANGLVACNDPLVEVERAGPDLDGDGAPDQNWLGARTTIQRWYADPLLERSWDGGVGTVFTHDHYGPSTHQQVGLYSTLLIEPEDSVWLDNETGEQIGFDPLREDGGPTSWQAIIVDCADAWPDLKPYPSFSGCDDSSADFTAHREFYFEFADFQHAYELGGGALGTQSNVNLLGAPIDIPSYADFPNAINPSFRQQAPLTATTSPEDIFIHPNWCPGTTFNPDGTVDVLVARPCPEAISADDPGTYALNFRNEPIGLRVFNGQQGPAAGQTPGLAGDLAFAYQSRTDRAIPELNVQPETNGISPYPPLTSDVQPGDPWTPLLRVYMGDQVRIRVQVGAHEEEHNFTIPGLKWRQEANSTNTGWRNSQFFGIDEYFNLDVPIVPDTTSGTPNQVDYIYTVGAELEGMWNGVWGILRTYGSERRDLFELPSNDVGRNGYRITNEADFNGICPPTAPLTEFDLTAVRAVDVLGPQGLVYNSRATALTAPLGGVNGEGPLIDPTALLYVRDDDLTYDADGKPNGLKPGVPVEPLMLRVNAGDCVEVNLTNALPADLGATEMPGFNALAPIVHKNVDVAVPGVGGITTFNANDITPSSYVGLTPQLLAFDPRTDGGFSTGLTTGVLVAPGDSELYRWYAGDVTVSNDGLQGNRTQFTLSASPVEFGAVGLMPADRIKGTENGFVGAMVVEPQDSCWITDPGTRAQATVWKGANDAADGTGNSMIGECAGPPASSDDSFRDYIVVMQNDVNLRYGGDAMLAGGADCTDPVQLATMACAVPSIAAEGPLGIPEDPQDSGQKAINYGADPLWFRLGITPDTPFGTIHQNGTLATLIPDVFANSLAGVGGDPELPVFVASPGGPEYGRFRVLMPGGHARGTTWTMHGHDWQRYPYVNDSAEIGDNPISEYYGAQEGINPTGHWEFVVDLGGHFDVTGDYLIRDQASFGSYQGLWALLRFDDTAPVVPDQQYELPKYTAIDLDLLGAAFDLDGDAATVIITGGPSFGMLTDTDGDGVYTYESTSWPACGDPFACTDSFTYTVTDGQGNPSDAATVTLTITNTAPEANHDTIIIKSPDTFGSVDVLLNDLDAEGDLDPTREPVVTLIGQPVDRDGVQVATIDDAVLGGVDGLTLTYTPPPGHTGVVLISYTVTDESGAVSNVAMVRAAVNVDDITITQARYQPQNGQWTISGTCTDPFLANGTTPTEITIYSGPTVEDDPISGVPPDIIGTATCIAGDPVGTWSFSGTSTAPAPNPDVFNFVSAESAKEGFYEAFPVSFAGQNNPPVATNDAYTIDEDTVLNDNVLTNDVDADFDPLTAVLVGDVTNGTLVLNADGSFTYTPDANYNGPDPDTFTYRADDGKDLSNLATVTITINAVNDPPVAVNDTYDRDPLLSLSVVAPGVLANDSNVEGDAVLDTSPISDPTNGTLVLSADGSFTYTPNFGYTGGDSFGYQLCEDLGGPNELCSQATVTITVGVNDPPVALADVYDAVQNTDLVVAAPAGVLANDFDADGDPLTAVLVTGPVNGTLTLNADGSFTYVPTFNFVGVDSFTYVANDESGAVSNVATVTITVKDVVTVTSATYRSRQDRWNIQGTVSFAGSTVDVYLCPGGDCTATELIGAASVDEITGDWSFNERRLGVVAVPGDKVIAVSSGGGESAPFPVATPDQPV